MYLVCSILILSFSITAYANSLLFDGGFESGTLQGWVPEIQGTAIVARRGSCFSEHDTRKLSIRGRYAGLLRSPHYPSIEETASLTSKPFIAGSGILFLALSEQKGDRTQTQYALNISLLNGQGELLEMRPLVTAFSSLPPGCPADGSDARFSRHFISTLPYQGRKIKLRFSQHPDTAQAGGFTLIDQVTLFDPEEAPILSNHPLAKAGIKFDAETQNLYLSAALPEANLEQTKEWEYSWLINGENTRRDFYQPCINDLKPGNYTAILTVRNASILSSDKLYFSVSKRDDKPARQKTPATICNQRHPLDVHARDSSLTTGTQ